MKLGYDQTIKRFFRFSKNPSDVVISARVFGFVCNIRTYSHTQTVLSFGKIHVFDHEQKEETISDLTDQVRDATGAF